MLPLKNFGARRAGQCLLLLRRLNTCPQYGLNPSQNLHKSPVFRENCKGRMSALNNANGVFPKTVSLAAFTLRPSYFSSSAQGEVLDDEFSETTNSEPANSEIDIEEGTVEISSSESSTVLESMRRKPIDELFKDAIGLSDTTGLEESVEVASDEVSDKPSDVQVESLKSKVDSQWQIINTLKDSMGDLKTEIKELKSRNAYLESLVDVKDKQKNKTRVESKKKNVTAGSNDNSQPGKKRGVEEASKLSLQENDSSSKPVPRLVSLFSTPPTNQKNEGQEKSSAVKRRKNGTSVLVASPESNIISDEKTTQSSTKEKISTSKDVHKSPTKKKGSSNKTPVRIAESHPWPEWISFLEHLNEGGYLTKAMNAEEGLAGSISLSPSNGQGFIKSAAVSFAKDHDHITKLLSGDDLKNVALFGCPSAEKKCIFAGKRLRSFFNIEEEIACRPCTLKDKCSAPFARVTKEKNLALPDIIRLLCIFGFNAGTGQLPISDEVRPSVLNLLKEVVNFSTNSPKAI